MKVFSKKKYFEVDWNCTLYCRDRDTRAWVDELDGKPVINNRCEGRKILDGWTEDVYNPVEETGNILNTCFPKGIPEPVNCRCVVLTEAPPKHPRYKIVIECNDDFTTARMFVDGYPVKGEVAKRNPADKFNWRIGAQTAFNRLWEKKKPEKPVVREVKRNAEPGKWVRIVNRFGAKHETYRNGDVLKVECKFTRNSPGWVYLEGHEGVCAPSEYVVLEGYKPE